MDDNKQVTPIGKRKPPAAGMGRKAGSKNKATKEIKDMIYEALDNAGGAAYLQRQAIENPGPFMSLVGKILPRDINNNVDVKGQIRIVSEFPD